MTKVCLEISKHVLNPSLIFKVKASLLENFVYQHGPNSYQAGLARLKCAIYKEMLSLSFGPT